MISKEETKKLSSLARVGAGEKEEQDLAKDLGKILEFVSKLKLVATSDVEEERSDGSTSDVRGVLREDGGAHKAGEFSEILLKSAPDKKEGYVKVKKVL
ncbi:MAG: Asp-tRNA(Asn)/Glu-tRNA(Gln) amidotransferase subunit GatC [Patescibacteria group bacterium]